jgi:hypothetical protein
VILNIIHSVKRFSPFDKGGNKGDFLSVSAKRR